MPCDLPAARGERGIATPETICISLAGENRGQNGSKEG